MIILSKASLSFTVYTYILYKEALIEYGSNIFRMKVGEALSAADM